MTSRTQNRAPFWCTALNYSEVGLPPYKAAVKHRAHRCQVGWKRRQMVPQAMLKPPLTNKREAERDGQNLTFEHQAIRKYHKVWLISAHAYYVHIF